MALDSEGDTMLSRLSLFLAMAVALAPSLFADVYVNSRPYSIDPGLPRVVSNGEASLQTILDKIYKCKSCVNAATDQSETGEWTLPTDFDKFYPNLYVEYAGNAGTNALGIWGEDASEHLTEAIIFHGAATAGYSAVISWADPGILRITELDSKDKVKWQTEYSGDSYIGPGAFGFYLQTTNGKFYSADALNSGKPQMLAYAPPNSSGMWTFAFEDVPFDRTDKDYNDFVFTAANLEPVPEPASIIGLGTGLLLVAGVYRRRARQK